MKKFTFLLLFVNMCLFAQKKSTGVVTLGTDMTAELTLDNGTSLATVTLSGPNDRWFALQFGSFTGGMESGSDLVYWNGALLVDARHNGIGLTPTNDVTNNWTLVSNTNNTPSAGLRTIVYSRPFSTGDANDFTFNYANTNIDLALAKHQSASFSLTYHGGGNRIVMLDTSLTVLGLEDFSLNATQIYPNPSNGDFMIKTKTGLDKINVYSQVGAFVKTIKVNNLDAAEINLKGLSSGVYLLELLNANDKSWKKIIVN
ncbi:T9SS type A sorting domain-containing protein [Flavobacterium sp.]|uniref:T9SS type A sorting domain-containing protein n=1 Tax=Flavobacterium sp. TaxID=239 RepID=UPI0038FCD13D